MTDSILTGVVVLVGLLLFGVGFILSWVMKETYEEWVDLKTHPFSDLITSAPHPECFDEDGNPILEEYICPVFVGFNEEGFDGFDDEYDESYDDF